MLRIFTIACVFWIGAANAQDCSQYMTAKYNAAVSGNLQLLYQYDALYHQCLNTQAAVAPVAPPPPVYYQPAPQQPTPRIDYEPTPKDTLAMKAIEALDKIVPPGQPVITGSPLSAQVPTPPPVSPQEQQAINRMLQQGPAPPPSSYVSQTNPFGIPPANQQSTLEPPPGYTDPFAGQTLPPPGQLGVYTNCTFNSPSCQ
jgi:hypothetical protein